MGARLENKVVLITGARRGIGRGIAIEMAREGAHIAANDVVADDHLADTVRAIRELGQRAIAVQGDVTRATEVERVVEAVERDLGSIDILVNNAGVESIIPFLEMDEAEWERVTHTNLKGEWLCAQVVVRRMVAAGRPGAIVNIGSVQAGMVLPGRTHYAPSKRAIEALTANLAAELAPHRIRVNCLHPGLIETDMTAWVMKDPQLLPIVLDRIAMHRAGQSAEIGRVAAFLASDDASYVTGQSLYVDGGFQIL
jgi:glucose 1-dehydrogenase/3-oxoacyl-[acyl-carrier protein] reductase